MTHDRTLPGQAAPGPAPADGPRPAGGHRFAYGTNGLTGHRLPDALALLAELGYEGVALTLDHAHLDPFAPGLAHRTARLGKRLADLGLAVVVETGARYLLDPRRKHAPTLLDENPAPRLDYLGRAVRVAADLGAEAVSLWSGAAPPDLGETTAWERLREGCARVLDQAQRHGVTLGFEPEPGMLVDTLDGYERLARLLGDPPAFGLTLDLGHCHCLEDAPVPDCVLRAAHRLVHVQIEDMRRGVHEHLEFGAGGMDFPPVLRALDECGYRGLVGVELPRHSHDGPAVAERSLRFLRRAAAC